MLPAVLLVALTSLAPDRPLATFGGHPLHVGNATLAITADGKRIITLSPGGVIRTHDAATGSLISRESSDGSNPPRTPGLSADGLTVVLMDAATSAVQIGRSGSVRELMAVAERRASAGEAMAVSGDGQSLAVAFRLDAGTGRLRLMRDNQLPRQISTYGGHAHAVALSQNADWVIVLTHERDGEKDLLRPLACQLFDVGTGKRLWSRAEPFRHVLITADDRHAVLTGGTAKAGNRVVDLPDGEPSADRVAPPFDIVGPPVVSPDGRTLFAATPQAVVAWDLVAGRETFRLPVKGVESTWRRMAVSPDGTFLVTNFDGLRKWDAANGKPLFGPPTPPTHGAVVRAVRFHPNGREFASLAADGSFARWDVATGRVLGRIDGLTGDDLRFGPRGWLVADTRTGPLTMTPTRTRRPASMFNLDPYLNSTEKNLRNLGIPAVQFSHSLRADGETATTVIVSSLKSEVHEVAWTTATGEVVSHEKRDGSVLGNYLVDVSPGGIWRLTGRGLNHAPTGTLVRMSFDNLRVSRLFSNAIGPPEVMTDRLVAADFNTIGGLSGFAPGFPGRKKDFVHCLVLELATARPLFDDEISGCERFVLSPDNRTLAVVQPTGISLLSLTSPTDRPTPLVILVTDLGDPNAIGFSPDGRLMAVGHENGSITLWGVPRPIPPPLTDGNKAWDSLGQLDPKLGRPAVEQLVHAPRAALDLFAKKLPLGGPPTIESIPALIAQLDSGVFAERDAATRTLRMLGRLAKADLEAAAKKTASVELRQRAEDLLKALAEASRFGPTPEVVRFMRAVEVLERIGSPEAVKMLETLTVQTRDARLTEEAAAALARLNLRDVKP